MFQRSIRRIRSTLFTAFVNGVAAWLLTPPRIRIKIYHLFGVETTGATVRSNCYFETNAVIIRSGSFVNRSCYFMNTSGIEIAENCWIAPEVMFIDTTHDIGGEDKRAGKITEKPIKVGKGCWIGSRVIILPGINIGCGCVIAAGAVVTKDCSPNGLYAGVPAKRMKDLP